MITVTVPDIEDVWRPLSQAEATLIPGLSQMAWDIIVDEVPDIEDKLAATPPVVRTSTVKTVMVQMLLRVLKNPQSLRQVSRSVDDWSRSETLDSSVSTGELYLDEAQRDRLNPRDDTPEYGVYTISLSG